MPRPPVVVTRGVAAASTSAAAAAVPACFKPVAAASSPSTWRLSLRVTPGARSSAVVGVEGQELAIRVAAPPVEGKANAAVVEFVDELLGSKARNVVLVAGGMSRSKVVEFSWAGTDGELANIVATAS